MSRQILKKEHIITDRLTLGPYRKEDRERLTEMMRNPEITATFMVPDYSEEVQFYTLADKLIEFSQIKDTAHLEYGVYLDGYLSCFRYRLCCEYYAYNRYSRFCRAAACEEILTHF